MLVARRRPGGGARQRTCHAWAVPVPAKRGDAPNGTGAALPCGVDRVGPSYGPLESGPSGRPELMTDERKDWRWFRADGQRLSLTAGRRLPPLGGDCPFEVLGSGALGIVPRIWTRMPSGAVGRAQPREADPGVTAVSRCALTQVGQGLSSPGTGARFSKRYSLLAPWSSCTSAVFSAENRRSRTPPGRSSGHRGKYLLRDLRAQGGVHVQVAAAARSAPCGLVPWRPEGTSGVRIARRKKICWMIAILPQC